MIKPSDIAFVARTRGDASLFMARYQRLRREERIGTVTTPLTAVLVNVITDYESFKKVVNGLWDQLLIDAPVARFRALWLHRSGNQNAVRSLRRLHGTAPIHSYLEQTT